MGCAMIFAMDIGDRIRSRRRALDMTQQELAAAVEVDKSAVAQWENGGKSRKGITTTNLIKVARALRVKVSDLTGDASQDLQLTTSDPDEIALIDAFRALPPALKQVHLQLLVVAAGIDQAPKPIGNPQQRRRLSS